MQHDDLQPINLKEIMALSIEDRHKRLAPYIPATAQDFLTDPAMTEFANLDMDEQGWDVDGNNWNWPEEQARLPDEQPT